MNKTELKLEYQIARDKNDGLAVIIVAAGASSRMKGINKQFLELGSIPVIAKTLLVFENCDTIKNIILVARDEDIFALQLIAEKYSISKLSDIVCGGKTRQESVLKGLSRLTEADKKVLVHDGARPFVTEQIIQLVAKELENFPAVTCAVKVKDTVKLTDENGVVIKTLERDSLRAVQTPQGMWVKEYNEAIEKLGDISAFTDDTSIMEAAGFKVKTVEGSFKNIKITTPEDIAIAKILEGEEE
jgi:2-C-methyl-D-erythritol 4-phosphate cytidylyltransferase